MLTEQEVNELRRVVTAALSVPLNSTADRVEVARRAVSDTLRLLSGVVSLDKPKPAEEPPKQPGPEQSPAPESPAKE
ncbi:MAG: hypothetical protein FD189_1118 [Elusimicrobia bacterium]|nr:MAG: hypothetical protein FD189_1118 [Elusimicrobiota bacterium]